MFPTPTPAIAPVCLDLASATWQLWHVAAGLCFPSCGSWHFAHSWCPRGALFASAPWHEAHGAPFVGAWTSEWHWAHAAWPRLATATFVSVAWHFAQSVCFASPMRKAWGVWQLVQASPFA